MMPLSENTFGKRYNVMDDSSPGFINNPASDDNSGERLSTFCNDASMLPKVTRKCVRYQVEWEVTTFNGQPVTETLLFDLSAIGAKIEGPKPLAPRNHLEFTYRKPGDDRERSHTGVVMWVRPLIHKPGCYQMGVKFYQTDWALDMELRQYAQS
jgi:hypothetical protein